MGVIGLAEYPDERLPKKKGVAISPSPLSSYTEGGVGSGPIGLAGVGRRHLASFPAEGVGPAPGLVSA